MELKYEHLLGLPFEHGKQDCYEIGRQFFYDNFGLVFPDYARPDHWWDNGLNLYEENFRKSGFELVDVSVRDLRPADVFFMAVKSDVPNHAGIYLGKGYMLHHFYNRFSEKTLYKGMWKNLTTAILRHKDIPDIRQLAPKFDIRDYILPHKREIYDQIIQ